MAVKKHKLLKNILSFALAFSFIPAMNATGTSENKVDAAYKIPYINNPPAYVLIQQNADKERYANDANYRAYIDNLQFTTTMPLVTRLRTGNFRTGNISSGYNEFESWSEFVYSFVPDDNTARSTLRVTNIESRNFYMPSSLYARRLDAIEIDNLKIPNEMNCTLICIQNLLNYYRYRDNIAKTQTDLTKKVTYLRIAKIATEQHGYSSSTGLDIWQHKSTCRDAFDALGYKKTNVNTFSKPDGGFFASDLCRNEPYILSSSVEYHSIYVFGWKKAKISFTSAGKLVEKNIIMLDTWDPNGKVMHIDGNNVVNGLGIDAEQVMYIASATKA